MFQIPKFMPIVLNSKNVNICKIILLKLTLIYEMLYLLKNVIYYYFIAIIEGHKS